ncbi:MAG: keywimysin-related RiPP [Pseudomonadota bacterium]
MDKKMDYEAPTLTEVGSFEEITQATQTADITFDGNFNGQPAGNATFS